MSDRKNTKEMIRIIYWSSESGCMLSTFTFFLHCSVRDNGSTFVPWLILDTMEGHRGLSTIAAIQICLFTRYVIGDGRGDKGGS